MNDFLNQKLKNLPTRPGVYIMRDSSCKIIYIGKATSLRARVNSYFLDNIKDFKNTFLAKTVRNIEYVLTNNEKEASILEESLIKRFQPKYNIIWKDDKRYPHIKIKKGKYPSIDVVRVKKSDGAKYFGPYPDSADMQHTLKFAIKIFGLRPCKYDLSKRKKECLYYFINKCPAPCIGKIGEKEYSNLINKVKMFLSGKNKKLFRTLKNEMNTAKKNLEFEKASKLRNTIFAVKNTLTKTNFKETTIDNILLNIDRTSYLADLSQMLKHKIYRIEGFDISNISGKYPVGSMVVFNNGFPDKSEYRKFKIRTVKQINDYEMISEVINRRYSGSLTENTQIPDLILIDGGKGHLSAAVSSLKRIPKLKKMPKVIALAKQNEEIFIQNNPNPVTLSKNSLALNLLKHIRDEAHRFAISYHKQLRKAFFIFFLITSSIIQLYSKEGTIYLKNGGKISGEITKQENGNFLIETKNCGLEFSNQEINKIVYTKNQTEKEGNFLQKMKNTQKAQKVEEKKNLKYKYDPIIYTYADKYGLDPAFVKAVIETESNFDHSDISHKGAIGLMQIMPNTAKQMKINPKDIEDNIKGGTQYLNLMLSRFGDPILALAGYNAGPYNVKKYGNQIPPYKETQKYVEKVLKNYIKHKKDKQLWYFVDEKGCINISDYPKDKRYKRVEK